VHNTALVVNIDKSERDRLQHFLSRADYRVLPTGSGAEALALCRDYKGTIDLLVTDLDLPGSSAWELAESATALRPGIVILYLSASSLSSHTAALLFGTKSHVAQKDACSKANMLLDVTKALIHKTHERIQ